MSLLRRVLSTILVLVILIISATTVRGGSYYNVQVGAWGDNRSIGNVGVRVQIRTHIYSNYPTDWDSFWVGDDLADGAFIQFGYAIWPGHQCLVGSYSNAEPVGSCVGGQNWVGGSDARWFWEYWPEGSGDVNFYGLGPANSAGSNGTWHTYTIQPDSSNHWVFMFDNQTITTSPYWDFQVAQSNDEAYMAAEKGTNASPFHNLGPVEFKDLEYLKEGGWHSVSYLTALVGFGLNTNTNSPNPYGVAVDGANHIIAGSGIAQPADQATLWPKSTVIKNSSQWNQLKINALVRIRGRFRNSSLSCSSVA